MRIHLPFAQRPIHLFLGSGGPPPSPAAYRACGQQTGKMMNLGVYITPASARTQSHGPPLPAREARKLVQAEKRVNAKALGQEQEPV